MIPGSMGTRSDLVRCEAALRSSSLEAGFACNPTEVISKLFATVRYSFGVKTESSLTSKIFSQKQDVQRLQSRTEPVEHRLDQSLANKSDSANSCTRCTTSGSTTTAANNSATKPRPPTKKSKPSCEPNAT